MTSKYNYIPIRIAFAAVALILTIGPAFAQDMPAPRTYVTDRAGVIPEDIERAINGYLQELEQKTTAQVLVLTVDRVPEGSIEEFTIETAARWGLGQKGKDNGLLLVVSVGDRQYRFEVGYGLEGLLPDSYVGSLGRQYLVPYFRKGDYGAGTSLAALAIARRIADDAGVTITGMPKLPRIRDSGRLRTGRRTGGGIGGLLFLLFLIFLFSRGGRGGGLLWLLLGASMLGGPRRGGWSGGSSGGGFGGFGSFGGGGGGGFGGGGATGSW